MKLNHLNTFNESFLSIDIKDIKKKAYEFHKTKECRLAMSEIDIELLNSSIKEINNLKNKYKSIDLAINRIINKSESKNEGIAGTILFTAFGLHALVKMLIGIKNGWSIGHYLSRLFYSNGYHADWKTFRDVIITASFIIYLIFYLIASNSYFADTYIEKSTGVYMNLGYKWHGLHDYRVIDDNGKVYFFKRTKFSNWDILLNDKIIGKCIDFNIYNLNGESVLNDITMDKGISHLDKGAAKSNLERLLKGKVDITKLKDIENRRKEINNLSNQLDSIQKKTFENVDVTKKLLKDIGIDYDTMETMDSEKYLSSNIHIAQTTLKLKDLMIKNNNIGYLSTFVQFIIQCGKRNYTNYPYIIETYNRLISIGSLSDKLRDNEGNLKKVIDFKSYEDLDDSISRVLDWQKVNRFVRGLPPTQKRLIWENGYFIDDLKTISQFLTKSIVKIDSNEPLKDAFFKKVSSIKDRKSLVDILSSISNEEPWDYNYWLDKINNTRNVVITWKSEEQKMIMCSVFTHSAIKKLAYMTSWCIFRRSDYFNIYLSKGFQFIIYDFSKDSKRNDSIIGATTTPSYEVTDCHDKSDSRTWLPSQFIYTEPNYKKWKRGGVCIKKEYITMSIKDILKKCDGSIITVLRNKLRLILKNRHISKLLDTYDGDDD